MKARRDIGVSPAGDGGCLVRSDALPWFPFLAEGVYLKLCRASLATGEIALLVHVEPGAALGRHYNHGAAVAYTISGHWRSAEPGWVAGPGDVVIVPAGSTRAVHAVGDVPTEAFVLAYGALEFLDEHGATMCIENVETLHGRYLAHCALHGLEPVDVAGRPA